MKKIESQLNVRQEGGLEVAIAKELDNEDKPLKDLLNEKAECNKDRCCREGETEDQ